MKFFAGTEFQPCDPPTQIFFDLQPYLPQILSYAALGKRSKMILGINLSEGTKSFFIWATIGVIQPSYYPA